MPRAALVLSALLVVAPGGTTFAQQPPAARVVAPAAPMFAPAPAVLPPPAPLPSPSWPPLPPMIPPPVDPAARRDWLKAQLDGLFNGGRMVGAKISVLVTEFEGGKALYARSEKSPLNAASNVKLITSAAALAMLGPEYRWKTTVYGPVKVGGRWLNPGGELLGDLYIRGSGDPTLTTQHLAELASDLASLGLRKVRGALVVDATMFDAPSVGPAFDQKSESAAFRSPSSATSLNGNAVSVTINPAAAPGGAARVVVEPTSPYFTVTGRIVTAKTGPAVPTVETADAGNGQTRITLGGRIKVGSEPRTFLRRVVHPELFLGNTFRQILQKRGIIVDKPLRLEALPAEGWRTLTSHDSPPLAVVVHELNKRSSNFAAEQVVRTLGAEVVGKPGTWEKGIETTARYLDSIGISRNSYRMTNGSGLYDSNRFSAEQIATVIRSAMRDFRIAGEFLASLSLAGADGTLAHRMGNTLAERYVRAKTGTLANASCLSGVVGAPGQKPLIFSILVNDVADPTEARAAQDRAAEVLVAFLEPARATATPTPTTNTP